MRAKVNPKPAARNGSVRVGSKDKATVSPEQVEASKNRNRQCRKSEGHEAILCRAARTRWVRSRVKRSAELPVVRMSQRATSTEADSAAEIDASPKPTTPTHLPTHNTRVKPTREAGSAWTTCYARQGKPEASGPQRVGESREQGQSHRQPGTGRGQQEPKPTVPQVRRS